MHIPPPLRVAQALCALTLSYLVTAPSADAGGTPAPRLGNYTGTLATLRTVTVAGTPARVASVKTLGRLSAVATIPAGQTRPVVQIVSGSQSIYEVDNESFFSINFTVEPPVITIHNPTEEKASFPTIIVQGNTITAVVQTIVTESDITRTRRSIFRLVRVSP